MLLMSGIKSKPLPDLHGSVVLVTGGSKGLGLLIARRFAQLGASVTICARHDDELRAAQQWLMEQGLTCHIEVCDVADRLQVENLVRSLEAAHGRIDYLINNAGTITVGPAGSMQYEDYEDAMGTMFWGCVAPTLAALPQMRSRRSGTIVNVTSVGGKIAVPHLLPYSTAKFAAVAFSEGLRAELAGSGVNVVSVVPGLMRTGSFLNARFKGKQQREFEWFSVLSSLPGVSIDGAKAAERVVQAAVRGEPELTLSLFANAGVRAFALAPGVSSRFLGLMARSLPSGAGYQDVPAVEGKDLDTSNRVTSMLRTLGTGAVGKYQPWASRDASLSELPGSSKTTATGGR